MLLPQKNPYFSKLPTLKKGSQWLAITNYFRDYIFDYLAAHPDFIPAFRYSHCADEMFFQTLICDTSLQPEIHVVHLYIRIGKIQIPILRHLQQMI